MRSVRAPAMALVGRTAECREIDDLLDACRGGSGGVLALRGEAGIGKTALLEYALRRADWATVLSARGMESESEIPFAGLSELLRPLREHLESLPERQAAALAGALALGPPTGADPFAVAVATLSLIAAASGERPVLVVVDDLQWVDASSAHAILFAARRVGAEPVAMLFAMRDDGREGGRPTGLPTRTITGLDRVASAALVTSLAGEPVSEDVAERLFVETRGNPLALVEIPALLPAGLLAGWEARGDEPLPVGERIERAFASRIAALASDAQDALLVAAASDTAEVDIIVSAMGLLGLPLGALEAIESAGLVRNDGIRLEFRHPLVRSCASHRPAPARRRLAHGALAEALGSYGRGDPTRRAWHLAAATLGRDEHVASLLEAAAGSARERSGVVAAARAYERAARLSPEADDQVRRLVEAADAWQLANHTSRAIGLLDEAATLVTSPQQRVDIEHRRCRIDIWRGPALDAAARLRRLADVVVGESPDHAVRMLLDAASGAITGGAVDRALETAELACELARPLGGRPSLLADLQLGKARILTGDVPLGYPLIMRAQELLVDGDPAPDEGELQWCAPALLAVEEYELCDAVLGAFIRVERDANAAGLLAYTLGARAELEVRTGRWAAAEADGTEAVHLAREAGQTGQLSYNLARLARLEAAQGRDDACRADVAHAVALATRERFGSTLPFASSALGLLALGRGRCDEAIGHLEETARLWAEEGFREPGRLEWQQDLVEAYVRGGQRDHAERALAELEALAGRCRRPGRDGRPDTACTLAHAAACRCRGLLAEGPAAVAAFETALAWHAWTTTPFELGRTQLCFGERLRRADRRTDARPHLRDAIETFERLAAEPWVERARAELAATGERVEPRRARPLEALTAQELQVALLVAAGATNKEAGGALFLTPKTIEFHLAKIFRKLDLRSRTELAAWAARQSPASGT